MLKLVRNKLFCDFTGQNPDGFQREKVWGIA
jgi:hypothetical protein